VSQVNLLPPDILQRQRYQRLTSLVIGVGVIVLLLVAGLYAIQVGRISAVNGDIDRQNASNAGVTKQIQPLLQWAQLQAEAQQKEKLLDAAYAGEISMSGVLQDLSRVIPSDAFLTGFSVQVNPPGTEETSGGGFVGSMTASGRAASVESLSSWLTRLESVKGWDNPWVTTISKDPSTGAVVFETGVDLSDEVVTARGKGAS
jgi:Tfp pilus assembly protein PilN